MKIKKFKSKQILKLYLLKSKRYENEILNEENNLRSSLTRTLTNFKKALQVIFKYHQLEKKILFIGLPKKLQFKINSSTNHVAVSDNFELQNFFSNIGFKKPKLGSCIESEVSDISTQKLFPKLAKKPDLVVIVSSSKTKDIVLKSYADKFPIIILGTQSNFKNIWGTNSYNVPEIKSSLSKALNQNLFFIGFNFLFKILKYKTKLNKNYFRKQYSYKQKNMF